VITGTPGTISSATLVIACITEGVSDEGGLSMAGETIVRRMASLASTRRTVATSASADS
jgi:hypothetical protein